MPTTTQAASDAGQFDYAKLPDGSYAKFPKGTSPDKMRSMLEGKGLLKAKPSVDMSPVAQLSRQSEQFGHQALQEQYNVQGPESYNWGKPRYNTKGKFVGYETQEPAQKSLLSRLGYASMADVSSTGQVINKAASGLFDWKNDAMLALGIADPAIPGAYFMGQGAAQLTGLSPGINKGDLSPDNVQNALLAASMVAGGASAADDVAAGRGIKLAGKGIKPLVPTVDGLMQRASELNTKALKSAQEGVRDKFSAGRQVAKEQIIGTVKSLPGKIEAVRAAKEAQTMRAVSQADAAGKTIDVAQDIKPIVAEATRVMNERGVLNDATIRDMRQFLNQLTTKRDLATGQVVPRDLSKLTVGEATELMRYNGILSDNAEFTKARPDAVNNLARRISGRFNDRLGQVAPDIVKLRSEQSALIKAREAADANLTKLLNDNHRFAKGIMYSGAGVLGMWIGLRELGAQSAIALGSTVMFSSLAKTTLSRTARAAFYAMAAKSLDRAMGPSGGGLAGPQGGSAGGGGLQGPLSPGGPQAGPQGLAPQALTAAGGNGAPFAPAEVVSTNAPAPNAPPDLPAVQRQLGGSLKVTDADAMATINKDMERRFGKTPGYKGPERRASAVPSQPAVNTPEATAWHNESLRLARQKLPNASMSEQLQEAARIQKAGPQAQAQTTHVAEGVSGVPTRVKALMDRLDALYERVDNPKSGQDKVSARREIEDIKKMIAKEVPKTEQSILNERMMTRERVAKHRAGAAATTSVAEGAAAGAASGMTPEQSVALREQAYQHLATFEDGKEYVKAIKQMSKQLRWTPQEEMTHLAEAIEALKQIQ